MFENFYLNLLEVGVVIVVLEMKGEIFEVLLVLVDDLMVFVLEDVMDWRIKDSLVWSVWKCFDEDWYKEDLLCMGLLFFQWIIQSIKWLLF